MKKIVAILAAAITTIALCNSATAEKECRYYLTPEERRMVEFAVFHESGNTESFAGQMLVAECILNGCERSDASVIEALKIYGYPNESTCTHYTYSEVKQCSKDAVAAVFDNGYCVIKDEKPVWYYSPKHMKDGYSNFHESMRFIVKIGGHKFFGEW